MSRNSTAANQAIVDIVDTVLNHYNLESHQCGILMTVPPTIPEQERSELAEALMGTVFQFQSILFQEQALLSLYSYNTTTGIVVDIGDHIDIVPVIDGYAIEGGIHRLPFGGNAITEYLTKLLTAKGIRYFSETETYINRFVKEDACFVSLDYVKDCEACESSPALFSHQINVDRFQLPDHRKAIVIDDARFKATEGLFTPGLWGKDVTGLHDLVWKAIQACPIDQRRLLLRNIYLSGGTSLLPGLKERLKAEISALAPSGNTVEIHASKNCQHAAFLGGAVLAGLSSFSDSVVTQDEWNSKGADALTKWCS
jgi:actin-related protein